MSPLYFMLAMDPSVAPWMTKFTLLNHSIGAIMISSFLTMLRKASIQILPAWPLLPTRNLILTLCGKPGCFFLILYLLQNSTYALPGPSRHVPLEKWPFPPYFLPLSLIQSDMMTTWLLQDFTMLSMLTCVLGDCRTTTWHVADDNIAFPFPIILFVPCQSIELLHSGSTHLFTFFFFFNQIFPAKALGRIWSFFICTPIHFYLYTFLSHA